MIMGMWGPYVPVHERRAKAKKKMDALKKKGQVIEPISIEGRTITREFWGQKWCDHIESFADYDSRLPRGRTYVRNGSVCHLGVAEGEVTAIVSGSSLYNVKVQIKTLAKDKWDAIKKKCSGMIGSMLELLQGKISKNVMEVVVDSGQGLFPLEKEISYSCSCPDWADMCKHVAAVLYGIGSRLDGRPELLFRLRGVDPQEMVSMPMNFAQDNKSDILQTDNLADLFGIDIDMESHIPSKEEAKPAIKKVKTKSAKSKKQKPQFDPDAITAEMVKTLRNRAELTVAQFADRLGATPASIYRWEKAEGILKLQSSLREALISLAKDDKLYGRFF
jgi:uncharacterized Zn finger protein